MREPIARLRGACRVRRIPRRDRHGTFAAVGCGTVRNLVVVIVLSSLAACAADAPPTEDDGSTAGASITSIDRLTGCHGQASSAVPADGRYVMTTFGGGADDQPMSCGGHADGTGWYAASRQRYGCGAHVQVEANGVCVVLATQDYGPDVCVEAAAHDPVMDLSPRAAKLLYGVSGAGWSDHLVVTVTPVSTSTPLGPCTSTTDPGNGGGTTPATTCASSTLDRDVDDGTCVQSASDGAWYACDAGTWVARSSSAGCATAYAWCTSATLGTSVPPRTCVQSGSTSLWYQCNGQTWVRPVDVAAETGPIGACASMNPL
jgi:hypothetical protein